MGRVVRTIVVNLVGRRSVDRVAGLLAGRDRTAIGHVEVVAASVRSWIVLVEVVDGVLICSGIVRHRSSVIVDWERKISEFG
ncbi:hypothetical protein LINPERPRIM_LOCUS26940, partial [Linum perenne]